MLLGLAIGAAIGMVMPTSGLFADDRARAALREDTAASLTAAASAADAGDPGLFATGALARVLLALEHGGGANDRRRAEALLKSTLSAVRTAPEALYARALLRRMGSDDPALDDDIAKKADKSKSPFALLARATRAVDEGKRDDALALFQRAALGADAPLRAQSELARLLVSRGELGDARAVVERARRSSPEHGPARIIGVLAAVLDDLREETAEERAVKLKKLRKGPRKATPKPGEVQRDDDETARMLALWRTPEEEEATAALDGMDERDRALLALFLQVLAAARGDDELASTLRGRVLPIAKAHPAIAARQLELSLLEGDTATAEELLAALESTLEKFAAAGADDPDLAVQQARLAALKLIPEEELRKRAARGRSLRASGALFPFGELAFDLWAPSIPVVARFDPAVVPDAALFTAVRAGLLGPALARKLETAVLVHKGDAALARGDIAAAAEAAAQARERAAERSAAGLAERSAAGDADVLFLDARIRLRQADRDAARDAIDAAMATAPDDPHVLLVGARLHYDNEGFIPARKALKKLQALGGKNPAALALGAMIDARAGDAKSAQAALAEARAIGADDTAILRANLLILREGRDLTAAREAAERLHDVDELRTTDPILRAWQADALARDGGQERASVILEEVIAQRNLGDAHYFLAEITGNAEGYGQAADLAPGTVIALEANKKRPAKAGNKPLPKKRRTP